MLIVQLSAVVALFIHASNAKVFSKCELAKELRENYGIPSHQIGIYVCIAERQSGLNTDIVGQGLYYGMYQMSSEFWCDTYGRGKACNLNCNNLLDDNLSDDLQCMQTIIEEHQRLSGNGFSAWPSGASCQSLGNSYIDECSIQSNQISTTYNNKNNNYNSFKSGKVATSQKKKSGKGKVYGRCELAKELSENYGIPSHEIGTYVCIAERQSGLNTQAIGDGLYYGMYQMSSEFWCDTHGTGKACNLNCNDLLDDDLSDDLQCMRTIIEEHQRLSGNGFSAWPSGASCQSQANSYIEECSIESNQIGTSYYNNYNIRNSVSTQKKTSGNVGNGKVYERCELARELKYKHDIPMEHIATWVCIAKHESNFNTSAIGRLNWDGSEDHGLFQISDIYWCGQNGKACGLTCDELRDNDITNDVDCIKIIHKEHTRLSGDGWTAWAVYPRCKGQSDSYINGCFDDSDNEIIPFKPQPGVKQPESPNYSAHHKAKSAVGNGKVYERCELARELRDKHNIPINQIATWVCIAKHESNFNTSAIGRLNWDGSEDHGLFQISDIYWCGTNGKACNAQCSEFEDGDISDDIECIKKIHEEHTRLSGDGYNAWTVYKPKCKGKSESFIKGCFDDSSNEILPFKPQPGIHQHKVQYSKTSDQRKHFDKIPGKGKVYEKCELAQELRYKHKIPMEQVATWVCIAKHESNFNTSAIGRLNWDGSEDHGLFQISDIYWCSPPGQGKGCGLSCAELEDSDITDDVECMLKIHEEHTYLSGDGFTAWTVYRPHCQGRSESYIDGCFNNDEDNFIPSIHPAVTQPPTVTTPKTTKQSTTKKSTTQHSSTTQKSLTTRTSLSTKQQTSTTKKPLSTSTTSQKSTPKTTKTYQSTTKQLSTTQKSLTTKMSSTTKQQTSTTKRPLSTSTITQKTTPKTTKTYQVTKNIEPVTTPEKKYDTTLPEATTISEWLTTNKIFTQPKTTHSFEKKSSTPKNVNSSPTVKPFNIFDLYFKSFQHSTANSSITPQQKSIVSKTSTSKPQSTKSYSSSTTKQPHKAYNGFNDQKSSHTSSTTTKSYRVPSSSTVKNVYSTNLPTINLKTSTTKKPITQMTPTTTNTAQTKRTSASTVKNSITQTKQQTVKATTTMTRKPTVQTTNKPANLQLSKTTKGSEAVQPFNVFSYYLTDYTSKAPPIEYKPIQFSDKSTVIFKKPDNFLSQFDSDSDVLSVRDDFKASTESPFAKSSPNIYASTQAPSFFNNFPSYYFNSGVDHNRIGRLITPHSIEYLLRLTTTPRTFYG